MCDAPTHLMNLRVEDDKFECRHEPLDWYIVECTAYIHTMPGGDVSCYSMVFSRLSIHLVVSRHTRCRMTGSIAPLIAPSQGDPPYAILAPRTGYAGPGGTAHYGLAAPRLPWCGVDALAFVAPRG